MTGVEVSAFGSERAPAGGWRTATVASRTPAARGAVLRLTVPDRVQHWPGQHYVVRLTADDGYTAQRSYSIASAPADPLLELYVENLPDGEVSGYLTEVAAAGDSLEVRGPIGGWFVWRADTPALGIGGGSGVVPLIAMLRHARDLDATALLRLAVSARALADLPYADELLASGATLLLTRERSPAGRPPGRLVPADLDPLLAPGQRILVCGSAGYAETVSTDLLGLGVEPTAVRVERFGPTG
ncbi:MAG: FAD-binding oxidoreductase [Propionibacteriaceae bacterium]